MIDIEKEHCIPIKDLPDVIEGRSGKRPSQQTVWRWLRDGKYGVVLERVFIAGVAHTSMEALNRWDKAITQAMEEKRSKRENKNR